MANCPITDAVFATDTYNGISVFDIRRGTRLMYYKSTAIGGNRLTILNNDYILAAENNSSLIHVWPINGQEKLQSLRLACPGLVGCCAVSPDGLFIAVAISEKLYIWQLSSGKLLNACSSHYQPITVLKWSTDGSDIITGGEDGIVHVWKLSHIVSGSYMNAGIHSDEWSSSKNTPRYTFSHHSIRITDLFVGAGGLRSRLFTASADKTCRIYDLSTGNQLLTIVLDVRPTCVVVDSLEECMYIGTYDGHIKTVNLREAPRTLEYHFNESAAAANLSFSGHTKSITCIAFSVDEVILASGSSDETIKLWHITSKQCVKTISMKGSVTNVIVRTVPENLLAHEYRPQTVIKSFQKRYDGDDNAQVIDVLCPVDRYDSADSRDTGVENGDTVSALKRQVEELKRSNKQLYMFAKKKILHGDNVADKNTAQKKGKTQNGVDKGKRKVLVKSKKTTKNNKS